MATRKKQTKFEIEQENNNLGAAIMLSVDIKANFELYAYRIIDKQVYLDRNIQLVKEFDQKLNFDKEPKQNGQMTIEDVIPQTMEEPKKAKS